MTNEFPRLYSIMPEWTFDRTLVPAIFPCEFDDLLSKSLNPDASP